MLRVALTGGIASGKSYVLGRIFARGIPTIDADSLVHEALSAGSPAVTLVAARFGGGVVAADGSVDRKTLGGIVFAAANARAALEAILHPEVFRRIDEWFAALPGNRPGHGPADESAPPMPRFAVADIPLLFEAHHEGMFDRIIVTKCSPAEQLRRLKERNGLSEEEARRRMDAQWPIDEKARLAHYVIDTSGPFEETDKQIDRVLQELEEDALY